MAFQEPHDSDDDDISTRPFVEHRAFGRGLHRFPIKFVPETPAEASHKTTEPNTPSIAEQYLAIVFPNGQPPAKTEPAYPICETCKSPIRESDLRSHHLSLIHQRSLPLPVTPSAIDRTRFGLQYLEKHGFDVDAGKGLGAKSEGRPYPIQPKVKHDLSGVGMLKKEMAVEKEVKLDAGKIRKKATQDKKKEEKLRRLFYQDDEVTKYLGQLDDG